MPSHFAYVCVTVCHKACVNVNAKFAIAKRLAVQIMNPDRIHETKKFSADNEKQSEKGKR